VEKLQGAHGDRQIEHARRDPGRRPWHAFLAAPPHPPAAAVPAMPLLGRQDETARLRAWLEEADAGRGRVIAVVGEAGIGKSRLLDELAVLATARGRRILSARSYETERVLAFGPWVDAFRAAGVIDDPEILVELPLVLRRDLARLFPELEDGQRAAALRTNPLAIFTALARLIAVVGARRPLTIVLDDFHWADEMSVRLLAFLARRLSGPATLLAISVRAEELVDAPLLRRTLDELSSEAHLAWTEIGPLSRADTLRLVQQVAASAVSPEAGERFAAQI